MQHPSRYLSAFRGDRSSYDGNSYNVQNLANRKYLHQEIATFCQTGSSYNKGFLKSEYNRYTYNRSMYNGSYRK